MKIVFLDAATLGNTSLSEIENLGELILYPTSTPQEAEIRVSDAEILIINKIKVTENLLEHAPKLKLICEAATGTNNIDIQAASRRRIPVKNVAGYSTDSVAQLAFMQILNLSCFPERFDREVKDGSYTASGLFTDVSEPFTELAGKRLGIIGMGTIGQKVASIATAFGMNVIYFSTSGTSHCKTYPSVSLDTLLTESDVVSIHAPLNERTNGLIGSAELKKMKPTAIIVNMARGGIIKEADLIEAVDSRVISGAASDVFTTEPLPANHPYLHSKHPEKLRFTPHVAWASHEALDRLVKGIAMNIKLFLSENAH